MRQILHKKNWFFVAFILLVGSLKFSVLSNYFGLNMANYRLNTLVNRPIYSLPTTVSPPPILNLTINNSSNTNLNIGFRHANANFALVRDDEQTAINLWRELPESELRLFYYSELARKAMLYEASLQWLKWGELVQPEIGDWVYWQAILHQEMNNLDIAYTYAERSLKLPLQHIGYSDIYYFIGSILSQTQISPASDSISYYKQALSLNQFQEQANQINSYFDLAETFRNLGEDEQAIINYLNVLQLNPAHYSANLWLGSLYWKVEQDFEAATEYLNEAISLEPNRKWAYRNLATILQERGNIQDAAALYQTVLKIDPNDTFAQQQLKRLNE
ncbi:tetratricopeptide repeat protein [Candidatus Leptofilum sp.]|uniref:tetratricopeptide repeat protein n=1 Tax=Candidatus Leptofilum sp. TaxID=3241576 RepID=UPI003B5971F4